MSENNIHEVVKSLQHDLTKLKFDGNGFGIIMELVPWYNESNDDKWVSFIN